MTADRYRKILLRLAITLIVVAVIIPAGLFLIGTNCETSRDTCAFGVAVFFILNLGVIGLTLLVLAGVLLIVSIRRCKDLGIGGFVAVLPVLLLFDIIGKTIQIWRWGAWWISPTSPIVSLLLSLVVVAVSLAMLGKMRSGTLKDAETMKPLAFWTLWASAIVITLAVIPGLLSIVTLAKTTFSTYTPTGSETHLGALRGFQALKGPYWLAVAKVVFIACILALMQTPRRPNSGAVLRSITAPSGRSFGRRQSWTPPETA